MKFADPVNIMLNCCIPDKKRLLEEVSKLKPGETVRIEIDNCVSSRAMVESYLKNKWCSIVHVVEHENSSVLHVRRETTI